MDNGAIPAGIVSVAGTHSINAPVSVDAQGIAVDVAAAGVVQVREVELVDLLVAHQLQQGRQVVRVHRRHREAQARGSVGLEDPRLAALHADGLHVGEQGLPVFE